MRLPHLYVVGSGLSVKDLVVLEGIQNLKENDQIKPEITTIGKFIPKNN
jgi:membrane fusion protein (multidrug efflux system)